MTRGTHRKGLICRQLVLAVCVIFSNFLLVGQAHASEESAQEKKKFNAGEMIMHHIKDAHEVHFMEGVAIYLPVIIHGDNGFELFSSSNFYHNPQTITDAHGQEVEYFAHGDYAMVHEKIYEAPGGKLQLDEHGHPTNTAAFDLSITKSVMGMFIVIGLLILFFGTAAKGYRKRKGQAPKGIQSFLEPLVLFIRDEVAKPSIGPKSDRFVPFLLTTFFFIWLSNILGLIPFLGGFNVMGTLSVTIVLATVVFIITTIKGNAHYWGHILWPPGVPIPIKIILVPIEIAGIFIKPLVLMVRLTANITAGHIIILAFTSLIFLFGQNSVGAGYGVGIGAVLFMVFMNFIELLVAFLQAYVFTLLAALYFGSAVEEVHH